MQSKHQTILMHKFADSHSLLKPPIFNYRVKWLKKNNYCFLMDHSCFSKRASSQRQTTVTIIYCICYINKTDPSHDYKIKVVCVNVCTIWFWLFQSIETHCFQRCSLFSSYFFLIRKQMLQNY